MTSVVKLSDPNINEYLTIPKGTRLLLVADCMFVLHRALKDGKFSCFIEALTYTRY